MPAITNTAATIHKPVATVTVHLPTTGDAWRHQWSDPGRGVNDTEDPRMQASRRG
jgi:hypothetical protein